MRKFLLCFFAAMLLLGVAVKAEETEELDTEVFVRRVREIELPVIMYHLVTENPRYLGKYGITPQELRSDLQYLKKNGYTTVVMQDLINFVERGKKLPKKPILLTFDDGNTGDFNYLLPLLKEFKAKAVVAVIGAATDKYTEMAEDAPESRYPNLTWPQVVEMHKSGRVEIQSHSYNLHTVPLGSGKRKSETPENYHARLFDDLKKFQDACSAHLGYVPTTFVYPLGVIGKDSRKVLEELGMVASISCQEGLNTIRQGDKDCLYRLKRVNRPSGRCIGEIIKSMK